MNCKPGDLAICVNSYFREDIGKVVTIFRMSEYLYPGCWESVERVKDAKGNLIYWHDKHMRPIRDNDGEDEMLRIAGKPREVETQ
jgi:hypothetical protein